MKNLFKLGFLAFALTLTAAACNSENRSDSADSTDVDTSLMTDSSMTDTMTTDTVSLDTTGAM